MNRNVLYAIIGALAVGAMVLAYQLYDRRHKTSIEITIDKGGVTIEKN